MSRCRQARQPECIGHRHVRPPASLCSHYRCFFSIFQVIKFTKKNRLYVPALAVYSVFIRANFIENHCFLNLSSHSFNYLCISCFLTVFVHLVYGLTFVRSLPLQGPCCLFPSFPDDFRRVRPYFCRIPAALRLHSCKFSLFRERIFASGPKPSGNGFFKVCAICTYTILNSVSFTYFERIWKNSTASRAV